MNSTKHRLDRFISVSTGINRKHVRLMLAQKRVSVNESIATNINHIICQFDKIELDGVVLQSKQAIYLMVHKPIGVVSATRDDQHKTIIDILPSNYQDLHICGRLDLNSSGLLLLTNDGEWSRALTSPANKIKKVYEVTLENPLTEEYAPAFAKGMYFSYEDITTRPATLEVVSENIARVTLEEGRYHQIKRMFGRFRNPVVKLHRVAIGPICLDSELKPGECRTLSAKERCKMSCK